MVNYIKGYIFETSLLHKYLQVYREPDKLLKVILSLQNTYYELTC